MSDDDVPVLTVTEHEVPVGDRKYAWTAVILAMALAVLASMVTVVGGALWMRERESLTDQVDELKADQNCRAEAAANLNEARAATEIAHVVLVIEITNQLILQLSDQTPDLRKLAEAGEAARGAAATAAVESIRYQRTVAECGDTGGEDEG